MTAYEKRLKLREFCESRCDCDDDFGEGVCPLHCTDGCNFEEFNDEELDEAYNKVFPESTEEEPTEPVNDIVNHPSHYTHGGMECIDEMITLFGKQAVMHFCLCNAWKYRKRCMYKNGEEDMKKSDWYIAKFKELADG